MPRFLSFAFGTAHVGVLYLVFQFDCLFLSLLSFASDCRRRAAYLLTFPLPRLPPFPHACLISSPLRVLDQRLRIEHRARCAEDARHEDEEAIRAAAGGDIAPAELVSCCLSRLVATPCSMAATAAVVSPVVLLLASLTRLLL